MARIWIAVLTFPPRLAAITSRRITKNRSMVIPSSRTRITTVTHHGRCWYHDSRTNAVPVSALSATGSATLPNVVTRSQVRAIQPSTKSVSDATTNTTVAAIRSPGWTRPDATVSAKNTGTSTRRSPVSPLATLSTGAGRRAAPTAGSGWVVMRRRPQPTGSEGAQRLSRTVGYRAAQSTAARAQPARSCRHRLGDQVDAFGAGDHRPYQVTRAQPGHGTHERCGAVDLGRLVRGPPLDPVGADALDEHLDRRAAPLLRALRAQFLDEPADPLVPAPYGRRTDLVRQRGRFGTVLVAVVEHPDRVQPRLGEEALQLGDVGPGLAREPDDDVAARTGLRREPANRGQQRQEPLRRAEPAHPAQYRLGRVLEGQVEVRRHPRRGRDHLDEPRAYLGRLQVRDPDPDDAVDRGELRQQLLQQPRVAEVLAVGDGVLADEHELAYPVAGQPRGLGEQLVGRAG